MQPPLSINFESPEDGSIYVYTYIRESAKHLPFQLGFYSNSGFTSDG